MTSPLETQLAQQIRESGLPKPDRECRFHATRRWRFDFCWAEAMIAVEIDGATWTAGRHSRGKGFENDCEKINQAQLDGWVVLRFTGAMVRDGRAINLIKQALDQFYQEAA